jgi:hypothetical protein
MLLSRAEFAYLVYPSSPYTHLPYRQAPGLVWLQLDMGSQHGLAQMLRRRSGIPLGYAGFRCDRAPQREGENTVWTGCVVRRARAPGDTVVEQLFGPIVERGGRFKFAAYANRL